MFAPVPNLVPVSVPVVGLCCGKTLTQKRFDLEARVGIEPTNAAFAEPCLTTWLPRHPNQPFGCFAGDHINSELPDQVLLVELQKDNLLSNGEFGRQVSVNSPDLI